MRSLLHHLRLLVMLLPALVIAMLQGCSSPSHSPKPEAFPRIDVPEAEYRAADSTGGYTLMVNRSAETRVRPAAGGTLWVDVIYPSFSPSAVYITLQATRPADLDSILQGLAVKMQRNTNGERGNLTTLLSDGGWDCRMIVTPATPVSPVQFVAVAPDSTATLFGTLYLNRPFAGPNDSIRPVIDAVERDMTYLLQCLK